MTNEEKSRVLSVKASCEAYFNEEAQKQYPNPSTETIARINAYGACMEMAEWKDAQFKEFLFGVTLHSNAVIVARMIQDKIKELEK